MVWDSPDKDGVTLRSRVEGLIKQKAEVDMSGYPEQPKVPYGSEYIWDLFWEVRKGVGGNGFSPNPISSLEILAYSQLSRIKITPFMFNALRYMDAQYLKASSETR